MNKLWIKNIDELATTENRRRMLEIIEAGYEAINTEQIIMDSVSLEDDTLTVKGQKFDLTGIGHIYVIGFGKASCLAASVLDKILGPKINQGVAIGLAPVACEFIQTYGGTHPRPSVTNVEVSEKILELSKNLTEKDLVIVTVSGGGSALLCWPMKECEQANRLYEDFLHTGGDILELNTVRKHISSLKGGGLAEHLYPAKVVGLIFSDVPGNHFELVASGPTYKDTTTIDDAQTILDKYNLTGYELNETPKDDKFFANVTNIPLLSNVNALEGMAVKARELGLEAKILSSEIYDDPGAAAKRILDGAQENCVLLAAGEPTPVVTTDKGSGGRCMVLGMEMLSQLQAGDVFAAIASDGLDNSKYAGIIEDVSTLQRLSDKGLDLKDYKQRFDGIGLFEGTGNELLTTGPTEANVSDFMILYRASND